MFLLAVDIPAPVGVGVMEEGEEDVMRAEAPPRDRPWLGVQRGIIGQQMPPPPGNVMGKLRDPFSYQIEV